MNYLKIPVQLPTSAANCSLQKHKIYGDSSKNKLIYGDNLPALNILKDRYAGRVKCIVTDPPYNTGKDFEHYDDNNNHAKWLGEMLERLRLMQKPLHESGSLWISIDDGECHYLKIACDIVFGRKNFIANFIWEKRTTRENRRTFSFNHDHILVYAKDVEIFNHSANKLPPSTAILNRYRNLDNDIRGPWQSTSATAQTGHATKTQFYDLMVPNGFVHKLKPNACWIYTQPKMLKEIEAGNIWLGKSGNNVPRIKRFLNSLDSTNGMTPETLWRAEDVGTNSSAKKHLISIFPDKEGFSTPKPEQLVARILHIATNEHDIVLDPFLGSGTVASVAHKMQRRWIGIESKKRTVKDHCIPRILKVIKGEDMGGVTAQVAWVGGGGFGLYKLQPVGTNT